MIEKAIHNINPNAEFQIINNDLDNIIWLNNTAPIAKELILAKIAELPTAEQEEQAKAEAKASALAKLEALGLTQEEVQAIL
jgi:hypothetical protein